MISVQHIDDLIWRPVENWTPIKCNFCLAQVGAGGLFSEVKVSDDAEFTFAVCSEACKEKFVSHPEALAFVNRNLKGFAS